jgi:hypothetical protein
MLEFKDDQKENFPKNMVSTSKVEMSQTFVPTEFVPEVIHTIRPSMKSKNLNLKRNDYL